MEELWPWFCVTLKYPPTAPQCPDVWLHSPLLTQAFGNMDFKSWRGKSVFPSCFATAHFHTLRNTVRDTKNQPKNGNCHTKRGETQLKQFQNWSDNCRAKPKKKYLVEDEKRKKPTCKADYASFVPNTSFWNEISPDCWKPCMAQAPSELQRYLAPWFPARMIYKLTLNCPLGAGPILNPLLRSWLGAGRSWKWKIFQSVQFLKDLLGT